MPFTVKVRGPEGYENDYVKDDEVLIVRRRDGTSRISAFGSQIPAHLTLSNREVAGGVYVWDSTGKSQEAVALSGQRIPVGGRSVRPQEIVKLKLEFGDTVEIGIVGTDKTIYQKFDEFDTRKGVSVLEVQGLPLTR